MLCFTRLCSRLHSKNSPNTKFARNYRLKRSKFEKKTIEDVSEMEKMGDSYLKRSLTELWKPTVFALGFSGCCFAGAAIWHYERHRQVTENLFKLVPRTAYQREKFSSYRQKANDFWNNLTAGDKTVISLIGLNGLVFLCWRSVPLRSFMYRYFSNSFYSKSIFLPMVLSVFSHPGSIHLALNMYVLWSFSGIAIDRLMGLEQFIGFYLSAGVVSSLVSNISTALRRSPVRSYGASGAILGVLTYACCNFPNAQLQVVFLPMWKFSGRDAVIGLLLFDAVGLLVSIILKRGFFDHAAHLGGSLFGIWYYAYGQKLIWDNRQMMLQRWIDFRTKKK